MLFDENRKIDKSRDMLDEITVKTSGAPSDQQIDDVVHIAASLLDCSMAMITDASAQKHVLASAVKNGPQTSIARTEPSQRWLDPLDAERMGFLFYCGFPLRATNGDTIGHLCVYDVAHRNVEQLEFDRLMRLSRIAAVLLERLGSG